MVIVPLRCERRRCIDRVAMSAKSFTERQGQYLAFIDAYTRVHGRPPAETDMQRHFPAHPAFRAPDGPHAGAPRPHPPPARRRAQHRGAPRSRRFARSPSPPTSQIHCAEELVMSALVLMFIRTTLSSRRI